MKKLFISLCLVLTNCSAANQSEEVKQLIEKQKSKELHRLSSTNSWFSYVIDTLTFQAYRNNKENVEAMLKDDSLKDCSEDKLKEIMVFSIRGGAVETVQYLSEKYPNILNKAVKEKLLNNKNLCDSRLALQVALSHNKLTPDKLDCLLQILKTATKEESDIFKDSDTKDSNFFIPLINDIGRTVSAQHIEVLVKHGAPIEDQFTYESIQLQIENQKDGEKVLDLIKSKNKALYDVKVIRKKVGEITEQQVNDAFEWSRRSGKATVAPVAGPIVQYIRVKKHPMELRQKRKQMSSDTE